MEVTFEYMIGTAIQQANMAPRLKTMAAPAAI